MEATAWSREPVKWAVKLSIKPGRMSRLRRLPLAILSRVLQVQFWAQRL